jgi:pimeloyl-ACP methyl ester carboxylesterase
MRCIAASFVGLLLAVGSVDAQGSAKRLEEASFIVLGGIEQWVTIRGEKGGNPVLLLVHGGPGDVQSPLVTTYAPYEKDFVVVQWDQRGAGRTYARNGAAAVSGARIIADGIELAEHLRKRFPKQPLHLFGHSWGSVVATEMALKRPDLFASYVGTGQVASWNGLVQFQFDFLKQRYKEKGDAAALATLEAVGTPDPKNVKQYFGFSRPIRQYMNPSDTAWLANLLKLLEANGETDASIKAIGDGMTASGAALVEDMINEDLSTKALTFRIPYYVIQGRHDLFTPTPLAEAYFEKVSAPNKRLIVLEDAGHFALATHQAEVIAALKAVLSEATGGL